MRSMYNPYICAIERMLGLISRLDKLSKQPDSDSYVGIANEFINNFKGTMITEDLITVQAQVLAKLAEIATTGEDYYYLLLANKTAHNDPRIGNHCKYAQESAKQGHPFGMLAVARQALAGYYKQSDKSIDWAFCCLHYLQIAISNKETWGLKPQEIDMLRDDIKNTINQRNPYLIDPMPTIGTPEFNELKNNFINYRTTRDSETVGDFKIHDMFEMNGNNLIIHIWEPPKKSPDSSAAPPTHQTPDDLDETRGNQANFKAKVAGNKISVEDKRTFINTIKKQIENQEQWKVRFLGGKRINIYNQQNTKDVQSAPPPVPTHIKRMYSETLKLDEKSENKDVDSIFTKLTDIILDAVNKNPNDNFLTKCAKMLKNFLCRDKSTQKIYDDMNDKRENLFVNKT